MTPVLLLLPLFVCADPLAGVVNRGRCSVAKRAARRLAALQVCAATLNF